MNTDKLAEIPQIGKTYYTFDDGKSTPSRCYQVTITAVIPFDKIDNLTLAIWKDEIDWENEINEKEELRTYASTTDYFVLGDLHRGGNDPKKVVFVRMGCGQWFSLGWWGSRLDIDGTIYEWVKKEFNLPDDWDCLAPGQLKI